MGTASFEEKNKTSMDSKSSELYTLGGSIARRVFFRAVFLAAAVSIVSLLRTVPTIDFGSFAPTTHVDCAAGGGGSDDSPSENATLAPGSYLFQARILNSFWGSFGRALNCRKDANLTSNVVTELMGKQLLNLGAESLCIGERSQLSVSEMEHLGFSSVKCLQKTPLFSFNKKKIVFQLEYSDSSFDFVFSKDLDKVSVPALLVLEVERVLKPGGIGALLVRGGENSNSSSTTLSELLRSTKSSSVVHVGYVNEHSLIVFKKKFEIESKSSSFYHHGLPADCASVIFTKPLIETMEPQTEKINLSYLPKFVDFTNRKKLVYVNIGVGESAPNSNFTDWFPPSYPIDHRDFSVYFVHYNTSILLSYVKRPRFTFVYHPGLAGKAEGEAKLGLDPFLGEEEFDFLAWFKETVENADFVVLKMNIAGEVEMKFMWDLFESGAICSVDEIFLNCSEGADGERSRESCMDVYRGLRNNGVYVHQWWDANLHQGNYMSYLR